MRLFLLLLAVLLSSISYCQTQQGYVKTQGRPNKPGKALSGVTMRWRGNMNVVLSGSDGKFRVSFPQAQWIVT